MDSLTHIAVGATVFEALLGRKIGNKAALWGAIGATIPDLDVFFPMGGAVEAFTYHRGFTHSVFFLAPLAPLLALAITKIHPATTTHWRRWLLAAFVVLVTHPVLDSFTVYGTQILWPLDMPPVSWSTIFIIDPAYSLPVFIGIFCALFMSRQRQTGHRMALLGLGLSTAYLAWSVTAKTLVAERIEASLEDRGFIGKNIMTTPTPFNTMLWRVLVMDGDRYHEGYISLFDPPSTTVTFTTYPTDPVLLEGINETWAVQRLKWFTQGFYSVRASSPEIVITDLRMGVEGSYVFSFLVGRIENGISKPVTNESIASNVDISRLWTVWARIWDPAVSLAFEGENQ